MKISTLLFCACSMVVLLLVGPVLSALSAEKKEIKKNIAGTNFVETTERSYMFVYPSGEKAVQAGGMRRISVTTTSKKPASAGAEVKKCIHEIEIQPGLDRFNLKSGEEVVMIDLPGEDDPLLLGTVEYGYENEPDVIRLYDEKGTYLGMTRGIDLVTRPDQANMTARPYYLKNAIENNGIYYIILVKEESENKFETLVLKRGAEPQKVPFSISIPDRQKCGNWYIDEFIKNGEGVADLVIKVKGVSCTGSRDTQVKYLKCSMAR